MIDFKRKLFFNAYKKRIPLTVTIEIIGQCNFRCVHCYIGDSCRKDILTYEQLVDFGNQIIEMGCLYVILTGGEVLLHPDFERIYLFFAQKGMCVSVFTNGSLITKRIIDLFVKFPPRVVEITMYGFSPTTYELVTKTNQFDAVKQNILLLKKNSINVLLKMFIVKENYSDFDAVYAFSVEQHLPFKYDFMILSDPARPESTHNIDKDAMMVLEGKRNITPNGYNELTYEFLVSNQIKKLFMCGAGRSSCWLKSSYRIRICNFLDSIEFDLRKNSFEHIWSLLPEFINEDIPQQSKCFDCQYRVYCDYCPAKSYLINSNLSLASPPDIYCKLASMRFDKYEKGER